MRYSSSLTARKCFFRITPTFDSSVLCCAMRESEMEWWLEQIERSKSYPSLWGAFRVILVDYLENLNPEGRPQLIEQFACSEFYELRKLLIETLIILAQMEGVGI